jgi:muramoyltetrapeptide carboxypeptidase
MGLGSSGRLQGWTADAWSQSAVMPRKPVCYVTAPSWPPRAPTEADDIEAALRPFADELGWDLHISELVRRPHAGHGAWSDPAARLADLRQALRHEFVWSLRGGFGCIQLLPEALRLRATRRPAFAGYSDNTVLHALWWKQGWEDAFYCGRPPRSPRSRHHASLLTLLRGEVLTRDEASEPVTRTLRDGTAEGRLFVGCLSVLAHLAGTPLQPDLRGAILCIEDIDEKPYSVDFALRQLHLAGALRGVRALVGGFFTYAEKSDYTGPQVDQVLASWAERLRVPALDRLPFGHLDDHLVLPTGRQARLSVRGGSWSFATAQREQVPWRA